MRMYKIIYLLILVICFPAISCQNNSKQKSNESAENQHSVINENIRFCESTYPYKEGILIGNFGTEQLNPLNDEGKGYISYYKDGVTNIFIASDGNLSAPKGMYIKDNYLFICDVNKIVIYNISILGDPQIITFPEDDLFINDLVANENTLYASVTNTGRIYQIDITDPANLNDATPVKWVDITGPNGLIINNGAMYIASYPADGNTTEANVIYEITDFANPVPAKFITISGQYDGIAMSCDQKTMYITNWSPAGISAIDMKTKQITPFTIKENLAGPADITVIDETMYIPDLPNSRVIIQPL
ncbi:hypothetical protein [Bacteroides sp.]|uniref:hypothetical protein n=1 Tax=Bacteroides sp. TaxID=29523 RepID=UPI0026062CC0|nr:hypothetical protein [Bacteroides sp.]MDD3038786.1 hypothetical protein [Bacteroides sp.]